jgi:hypothetical protein
MMLPEGHGVHPAHGKKRFFNLSTGAFARVCHPFLSGLDRVLDSVDGLLLLQQGYNPTVWLLHPFTGDTINFPPLVPLLQPHWDMGQNRLAEPNFVASFSVSADGTVTAMIVHQYIMHVFFATTKDQEWSVSEWCLPPLSAPISFQEKLYILEPLVTHSTEQHILRLDPPSYEHGAVVPSFMPPKMIATCPTGIICCLLAECNSEILLVGYDDTQLPTSKLAVYRLADLAMGKVVPITSIGGNTLFLDIKMSAYITYVAKCMTSSSKAMPIIATNTIIRNHYGYPWQYDLGTGIWSQIMGECVDQGQSATRGCNCNLIYHIYQICHCKYRPVGEWLMI